MTDAEYTAWERAQIVAASGSGGSAQGVPPQMRGTLRFGESAFGQEPGGPVPPLTDDDGNVLTAEACGQAECIGSHVWGEHRYCAGPDNA